MNIVNDLKATREKTLIFFDLDPGNLSKSYGPGKWNVRQLLHHIADAETVLYDRIRRTISNPEQVVWGFAQDKWANQLKYDIKSLEISKNVYVAVRNAIIELAEMYYNEKGLNQAVHSRTGKKTLKDFFDKVVWHNQQHLVQIEKALSN